jgi:predicted acetyltransferase
MSTVKPIPDSDIEQYVTISANAYPGFRIDSEEDRSQDAERLRSLSDDPTRCLYGLYRQDQLMGGMIFLDFDMTFMSERLPAGGVGRVAVDLMHKKEKVARDMMKAFIDHYRERAHPLLLLYPFRPDFYYKMGFGYGSKISSYRFRPASLPVGGDKGKVRFLDVNDKTQLFSCYNRHADKTHGMIRRNGNELDHYFKQQTILVAGFFDDENLLGYMVLKFELGATFLENTLQIVEAVYENREELLGLLAFLQSQLDQVAWITYATYDESFHYLLKDPRNESGRIIPHVYHESNTQGVGLMYRVIDVPGIFSYLAGHEFGRETLRLRLKIVDNFVPENDGSFYLTFEHGKLVGTEPGEEQVGIELAIQDFSSMIVGSVRFRDLFDFGLAQISDQNYLDIVDSLFKLESKPVCLTRF